MSIAQYTLQPDLDGYTLISTEVVGGKGDPGPRGPSATPGMEVSDPYVTDDGHVAFDFITHWRLHPDGTATYEPSTDSIPPGERAWFDWDTLSLTLGGPGRPEGVRPLYPRGEWKPNTTYDENDVITRDGNFWRVQYPFRSEGDFEASYLELLAGTPAPRGVDWYGAREADIVLHTDEAPQFVFFAEPLGHDQDVVLSRYRTSWNTDDLVINASYTITRRTTCTGSALNVRADDGTLIVSLLPGQWVEAVFTGGAFTQAKGGALL